MILTGLLFIVFRGAGEIFAGGRAKHENGNNYEYERAGNQEADILRIGDKAECERRDIPCDIKKAHPAVAQQHADSSDWPDGEADKSYYKGNREGYAGGGGLSLHGLANVFISQCTQGADEGNDSQDDEYPRNYCDGSRAWGLAGGGLLVGGIHV